jgi:AraC family ethanolamine operon transcriptional activator
MKSGTIKGRAELSTHDSDDAWLHSRSWTDWSHEYEQLLPGRFHGTTTEALLGPLQIVYERVDGAFTYYGHPWRGARLFFAFLPGSGDLYYAGRKASTEGLITHRWDAVGRVTCSRHAESVAVAVNEEILNQYLQEAATGPLFDGDGGGIITCVTRPEHVARFQRCVVGVLRELTKTPTLINDERRRVVLQNAILGTLIDILPTRPDDEMRLPRPSTRAYVVDRAIQFMEARIADPIAIRDVCAAVRVCPRTIRYSFEHVLGITPTQYLRAARLNRVRRELASGSSQSVQSIAARWGFWHMGRFASYYRRTFAEYPSNTSAFGSRTATAGKRRQTGEPRVGVSILPARPLAE